MPDEVLTRPRACGECAKAKAKCSLDFDSPDGSVCDRCLRLTKVCMIQASLPRKRKRTKLEIESGNAKNTAIPLARTINDTIDDRIHGRATNRSESEDLEALSYYRTNVAPNFCFVRFAEDEIATLSTERPLVCKAAILAAINKDVDAALVLEDVVLRYIAEHIIVQGERNLDLLQGLLILLAFYHFNMKIAKQVTTLMQLATSVLSDLGLNRHEVKKKSSFESQIRDGRINPPAPGAKNHEEMRAYCGCFYLASIMSTFFHKTEPLPTTTALEHCCTTLDRNPQHDDDRLAVHLIRFQQLRQRMATVFPYERIHTGPTFSASTVQSIQELFAGLTAIRRATPPTVTTQGPLRMHYLAFEVVLYEHALAPAATTPEDLLLSGQRVKLLTSCLYAVKSLVDIWLSMPPRDVYNLTCATQFEGALAIIALYKLSTFKHPSWHLEEVKSVLDFSALLDDLEACLERSKVAAGVTSERHVFSRSFRPLGLFRNQPDRGADENLVLQGQEELEMTNITNLANFDFDAFFGGFDFSAWELP